MGNNLRAYLNRHHVYTDEPFQPNLCLPLYFQLKDAILNGTHPVTLEEAVTLAAMQCQVELGNYSPEKFRPGYLE